MNELLVSAWSATQLYREKNPNDSHMHYFVWFSPNNRLRLQTSELPAIVKMKMLTLQMSDDMKQYMRRCSIHNYSDGGYSLIEPGSQRYFAPKELMHEVGWGPCRDQDWGTYVRYCIRLTDEEWQEVKQELNVDDTRRKSKEASQASA